MSKMIILGKKMLNVLKDVIRPTHEFPTEDENPNTFEAEPSQREKNDDLFAEMKIEFYLGCQKFSSLNFLVKLIHLKVLNKWMNRYAFEIAKRSIPRRM